MSKIVSIMIDSREKKGAYAACKKHFPDAIIPKPIPLPTSDYYITTTDQYKVLIERKTVSDLLSSIADGGLLSQCARMIAESEWSYLVVVGAMSESKSGNVCYYRGKWTETGWSYSAVQGALLSVQELGVKVVHTGNFLPCIDRIANRGRGEIRVKPSRSAVFNSGAEMILTSLPGIGQLKALDILSQFGNVSEALSVLTDLSKSAAKISGVGNMTKIKIRKILGLSENQKLSIGESEND